MYVAVKGGEKAIDAAHAPFHGNVHQHTST